MIYKIANSVRVLFMTSNEDEIVDERVGENNLETRHGTTANDLVLENDEEMSECTEGEKKR